MKLTKLSVMATLLMLAISAQAAVNLVQNGSFEAPITSSFDTVAPTGWSLSGVGGVWQPLTFPSAALAPADGLQIGFLNGGTMSQDLGALQPSTVYHLSIEVAGRADGFNPGINYSVSMYNGATLLASVIPVVPITSKWTTLNASYTSASVPSDDLSVVISGPLNAQLDFDNVIVTATPVPEPSTFIAGALLILPFGLGAIRRARSARLS